MVSLQVNARQTLGAPLKFSATGLPPGLSIDTSTGLISGQVAPNADTGSPYTTTVTAANLDGSFPSAQQFTWVVKHVAVINPGDQTSRLDEMVNLPLTTHYADGGTLAFRADGLPSALSIDANTGTISGQISDTADTNNPYTVTVSATDGTNTDQQTFTWTVGPHVVLTNPGDQTNGAGESVSLPISAFDQDGDTVTFQAANLPKGLSIDSDGTIHGTIDAQADSNSPYTVTITATDSEGFSASQTFTWTVTHLSLENPGPQLGSDNGPVSLALQFHDVDPVTFTADLPKGLSIGQDTGIIEATFDASAHTNSPYTVTVTATDQTGHMAGQTFLWTVAHVGLANPGDRTNGEGDAVSLPIMATDPDGDKLAFSAAGLPPGLDIDSGTGVISGNVALTASTGSPYTVTVSASDGSLSSSQTFTWTVTPHITITDPGAQQNLEGDMLMPGLQIHATDVTGDPLTFSAEGLPHGLGISSEGLIAGTIDTGDAVDSPYAVTVTASDGTYSSNLTFTWTVRHPNNQPPVLQDPGIQGNHEGDVVSLQLVASDPDGDKLTYSASGLPAGLNLDPFTGLITGTLSSGSSAGGPYTVTVSVDDGNGETDSQTFTWMVNKTAIIGQGQDLSFTEGVADELTVATFTTPDPNTQASDFTAAINWGDGSTEPASVQSADGQLQVLGTHQYFHPGAFAVTVTLTGPDGVQATATSTATVAEAPLVPMDPGLVLNFIAGQGQSYAVAYFTDTNPNDSAGSYSALINWGDGQTSGGTVSGGYQGKFEVDGSHSYADGGGYPIQVTITDADGTSTVSAAAAQVNQVAAGSPVTLTVSTFTDRDPNGAVGDYTATIDWGDGSGATPATVTGSGNAFSVTGTYTYRQEGTYTVKVDIQDHYSDLPATGTVGLWTKGANILAEHRMSAQ